MTRIRRPLNLSSIACHKLIELCLAKVETLDS